MPKRKPSQPKHTCGSWPDPYWTKENFKQKAISLLSAERKRWLKSILPEEKHIPDDEVQVYGMDWELGVCSGWNDCIKTIKEKALND